ncbi:methylphosphotriester-DNA--protein-cysteine methyltransferase [Kribbella amoyensis]|uniref:Methylphosphotriester-DNA--protein-cysteine methyltransferase n=1 Tax=Kribbella amoyensis TaxID=996641 RepID=A0A561BUI6_9ACTN|nr:helix-turn-helix transcriptional regulator [Kribbella amoyensis]TWD82574.1 methylphosphotriester-DNA--protein-cysteine methyltransferase [Kribbella amoyensis]
MIDDVLPSDGLLFARRDRVEVMTVAHRHRGVELNLVVDGTAVYLLDRHRYHLGPGTLVWLFPGQGHLFMDASPGYRDWLCVFDPAALGLDGATGWTRPLYAADPPGVFVRRLGVDQFAGLDTLFRQVEAAVHAEVGFAGRRYAILAAWEAFQAAPRTVPDSVVHPAVAEAAALLRDSTAPPTVPMLARAVDLTPAHLSRLFARQMGMSITQFRNEHRFRRFLNLYGTGQAITMLEAALEAGFGSYAQFHRIARSLTGLTPADYLRKHRRASADDHARPDPDGPADQRRGNCPVKPTRTA